MADVQAAMGNPDDQRQSGSSKIVVWNYGFSSVRFQGGKVLDWSDHSHKLRVAGREEPARRKDRSNEDLLLTRSADGPVPPAGLAWGGGPAFRGGPTNPDTVRVRSYTRADGTQVDSHIRTASDYSRSNNFSSSGNVSPNTGRRGYRR